MNRHRPRAPRHDGATIRNFHLDAWRRQVEGVERQVRRGGNETSRRASPWTIPGREVTGCPPCDGDSVGTETRAHLERLMATDGRRAHRLRAAVTHLDARYRDATMEVEALRSLPWWLRRSPWA